MKRTLLALWFALAPVVAFAQFGGTPSPCSGDLNSSCQVTAQHFASPLPAANGGTGGANGIGAGATRVMCSIRGANFNVTTDQACTLPTAITAWVPTQIIVTNCSASLTTAAGGVYPATSKGGTALVGSAQVYTTLTASTIVFPLTAAAGMITTRQTIGTVYLSLTLAQGSAATCDFFVLGQDLS
jgi:hypothetical protein